MGCSLFLVSDDYERGFSSDEQHILDSCNLCKKPLGSKDDIFMYRGDTPFCSEECRLEKIEMDETMEMKHKRSHECRLEKIEVDEAIDIHLSASSGEKRFSSSTIHVKAAPTVVAT